MWPAIDPSQGRNLKVSLAGRRVISVKDNNVSTLLLKQRLTARSHPSAVSQKQRRSASIEHWTSLRVYVGPGNLARPAAHGFVTALGAAATQIEGHKQIEVVVVVNDEWSFNRLPIAGQPRGIRRRIRRLLALRQRIDL